MLAQAVVIERAADPAAAAPGAARPPAGRAAAGAATSLYFAALGIGFILLKISLIQRFVLFLGYPTYALTVVMLSLLVSTGIGSLRTSG